MDGLQNQDDENKDRIKWVGVKAEKCHEQWWAVAVGWVFNVLRGVYYELEPYKGPRTG